MLKIFPYYASIMLNSFIYQNYAGIIGWSLSKTPFKLPIYHISKFDEMFKCFSQTY